MNRYDLAGRSAIVTGAAGGIGFATARLLALSGASVALWDIDPAALDRAAAEIGGGAITARLDVADPASVTAAAQAVGDTFGAIDILVNSAGILGPRGASADYPLEAWHRVLAINLTGTFLCCQAVLPAMVEQGGGTIINVASIAAKEGAPTLPAYAASKAAVIGLTKTLAFEYADRGVTVNAIAPAAVKTEILAAASAEQLTASVAKVPMGRLGEADEVARLACWMASADCSFTTGYVFDATGGRAFF